MHMRILTFLLTVSEFYIIRAQDGRVCRSVKIPMCIEMPYNTTRMPNLLQHRTQEEAAIMAHEFLPLVDIGCSPHVRFFICSVFAPMCAEKINFGIPSCRSVCYAVRESCLPVLKSLNFSWPPFLRCELFPQDGLCMMPPSLKPHLGSPSIRKEYGGTRITKHGAVDHSRPIGDKNLIKKTSWSFELSSQSPPYGSRHGCSGHRLWVPTDDDNGVCAPLCEEDFLFKASEKKMAAAWSASWAFVCMISTMFTLLTFCLDTRRFQYPERPVLCLAFSYFCYSVPFLIRSFVPASRLSCETDPASGIAHLVASGTSFSGCVATFLLQYYFNFASELWWTVLTLCWFLCSGRFWGTEGLKSLATYFHLVAWGVPAVASVLVIIFRQIDGDELTGLCYVGNLRPSSLLYFVILPQTVLLFLGTLFILQGFVGLFRIRNTIRKQCETDDTASSAMLSTIPNRQVQGGSPSQVSTPTPTSNISSAHVGKLERLMIRLGVYVGLSTIPAIFVMAFHYHFYFSYEGWIDSVTTSNLSCEQGWTQNGCSRPRTVLSLFRIFMSLVIGVTSGIWVWSPKTFLLWKKTLMRIWLHPTRFRKSSAGNTAQQQLRMIDASILTTTKSPEDKSRGERVSHSDWEARRSESSTRTEYSSSRHYLLRNSESSFV